MEYKLTYDKYAAALKEDRLLGLKCKKCGAFTCPPSITCLECSSIDIEIAELSGRGEIDTFTVIRVPPEGFEEDAPYIVARVKLDEGPFIIGRLISVDPEKTSIDLIGRKVKIGHMIVTKDKYKFSGVDECVVPTFSLEE